MNVNIDQTRDYYRLLDSESQFDCNYCINYRLQIKTAYPDLAAYLNTLGVDIEKPYETSPLEPDENGFLEYCCCQYIVFGSCPSDYHHQINDVVFRLAASYPGTGIEQEHFVLEFYPIQLRWNATQ